YLSATGDFVIAGEDTGTAIPTAFKNLRFVQAGEALAAASTAPSNSYPDGAETLFLLFDGGAIANGTPWTMRWRVDNDVFYEVTQLWSANRYDASGQEIQTGVDFATRLTAPNTLPDGTYTAELIINNIVLAQADVFDWHWADED
ncbi:hypothetical protein HC776_03820, partial [bacterium]|nr:hypothetical protein [bacterium]